MILVDSSVWIDYFRDATTPEVDRLDALLGTDEIGTADLVLAEVLQGTRLDRDFDQVLRLMSELRMIEIGGKEIAVAAARNFRVLRSRGVTVRKTIDTLIATRCIEDRVPLLYSDRDFDPFVDQLGLISAMVDREASGG